ncbi:macro domain-containing protein [Pseudonocardia spinosispora]|uniref:macro domain-containing protein n=1 Tax=Pseudonocardia spinosispora TaxID=103441 RepID=UPI000422F8C4|nr:macro domain-containing protein [Pseudonocardia spinosispora]
MADFPELVLVAVDEPMASAWDRVAAARPWARVFRGSVTDLTVDAVVSPANSFGLMGGGIDGVYARWLPGIERRVRAEIGSTHADGELPVGSALLVSTGAKAPLPAWLISAPTMRNPGERLDPAGENAYAAAMAILTLWRDGTTSDGEPVKDVVRSFALPGLGTGVGGLSPRTCADRVTQALDDVLGR